MIYHVTLDKSEKDALESVYLTSVNSDDLINAVIRNLTKQGLLHITTTSTVLRKLTHPTLSDGTINNGKTTPTSNYGKVISQICWK